MVGGTLSQKRYWDEHRLQTCTEKGLIGMKIGIYGSSFDLITKVHLFGVCITKGEEEDD